MNGGVGDNVWFGTYVSGFAGATLGGATEAQAHTVLEQAADAEDVLPGTAEY